MIDVPVFNTSGEQVDTIQVDEAQLGGEVRPALIKQAVVMYHANQRQGTHKTKGRGEVSGSTRKVYRQKGTGNARVGPVRNPVRKGGGHAKQKLPKDWSQDMPKKQRRLATKSALLAKFLDGSVKVIDDIELTEVKTKVMAGYWKALGLSRTILFALPNSEELRQKNADLHRAGRNLAETRFTSVQQLNAFEILKNRTLLLTRAGLDQALAD